MFGDTHICKMSPNVPKCPYLSPLNSCNGFDIVEWESRRKVSYETI